MPSAVAARRFSSTPLPMALVDFEIVSPVEFLNSEAPSESFCLAPPIVEEKASPVALVMSAAVSDNLREPSFVAAAAVSETRLTAWSLALRATFCVLSRVLDAACWAVSVIFFVVSRTAEVALAVAFFVASSAADFDD